MHSRHEDFGIVKENASIHEKKMKLYRDMVQLTEYNSSSEIFSLKKGSNANH